MGMGKRFLLLKPVILHVAMDVPPTLVPAADTIIPNIEFPGF